LNVIVIGYSTIVDVYLLLPFCKINLTLSTGTYLRNVYSNHNKILITLIGKIYENYLKKIDIRANNLFIYIFSSRNKL